MRYVDVTADVVGRDVGAVLADVKSGIASIPFAIEYHAEVSSAALVQQESQMRLIAVLIGTVLLAFLLLQAAFGAWRLAFLVLLAVPAAAIGGVVATLMTGDLFSIGALAGLITVVAITVRHAVALVDRCQRLERAGGAEHADRSSPSLGPSRDWGPILITALGTAAFALPFIVLGDIAGLEVMRPMAVFVLGGLVIVDLGGPLHPPDASTCGPVPSPASETESLLSEPPAFEPTPA